MRSEQLYLTDIVEAADAIEHFISGITRDEFIRDELRQSAVLQKLAVIGEAAGRLSGEFRKQHSEIEWGKIVGFRNVVVHAYFSMSIPIVWVTATQDVVALRNKVASILREEFGAAT